jgi:phage shock protein PspC (stress-responsive transcriptional regulator)
MTSLQKDTTTMPARSFRLDRSNAKFMGVCGGIANYFGWDANLVRIAWAIGTVLGFGSLILIYLAIGLIAD